MRGSDGGAGRVVNFRDEPSAVRGYSPAMKLMIIAARLSQFGEEPESVSVAGRAASAMAHGEWRAREFWLTN